MKLEISSLAKVRNLNDLTESDLAALFMQDKPHVTHATFCPNEVRKV